MTTVKIATDFSATPGARFRSDGPSSGEEFREKILMPLFENGSNKDKIHIDLDEVDGYTSSFLKEAFGGLAGNVGAEKVKERIVVTSKEFDYLISKIDDFIVDHTLIKELEKEITIPNEHLEERLEAYARTIGVPIEDVISIKFRPVMSGAQYTDPFGFRDANAYTYDSEYKAGRKILNLSETKNPIVDILASTISHPSPRGESYIWKMDNTQPDVLWIQHETGLEILGDISAVLGICTTLYKIYTEIQKKIQANRKNQDSDRYYRNIEHYRVEIRTYKNGKLHQSLVIRPSIHTELSIEVFENAIYLELKGKHHSD